MSLLRILAAGLFLALPALPATFNSLATFQAATTNLTLLNFDTDADGQAFVGGAQIGSAYSVWGASFPAGNYVSDAGGPVSAPYAWFNNTLDGNDRVFDVDFTLGNITAVGVFNVLYSATPNGAVLRAYDSGNNLLASVASDSLEAIDFFGFTTAGSIARVTVTVIEPAGWGLDDLYFGQALSQDTPVPEPSALWLCGAGLAALLALRRR